MSSYEDLFEASVLEVIAPPPSLEFPTDYTGDKAKEWVSRMRGPSGDRKAAFFDENLDFFLTIRFPSTQDYDPSSEQDPSPPSHLLSFLAHLQISYETSYISPSANTPDPPSNPRMSMPPPRNSSMQRNRPGNLLAAGNPSMFPPHTPHPIPSAAESDLKYVQSQGTPLVSAIWGDSDNRDKEAFALLWDGSENNWLAVYRMSILVLYMITKVPDPLLCITVSTTLRNRPLPMTGPRRTLAALLDVAGGLRAAELTSPIRSNGVKDDNQSSDSDDEEILTGLQEVNLLEGLTTGPTFTDANKRLSLPSTRLGSTTRMHAFSLGPASSTEPPDTAVPYSSGITSPPPGGNLPRSATLRKSFRKTLKTHLGFRVRMRTVFVPYFLLPQSAQNGKVREPRRQADGSDASDPDSDIDDDILEEQEQREAGNEEHTVVLSVEVENLFAGSSPAASAPYHFEVERVDVAISGTGARASFIGWGSHGPDVFPLQISPREQVNLLYAVSFLRGPEVDEFSLARPQGSDKKGPAEELQRAVTIHLIVRPYETVDDQPSYPTHTFPSRWNCVLDLASSSITKQQKRESTEVENDENQEYFVLPTPASPFPTAPLAPPTRALTPLTTGLRSVIPLTAVAGSKRHTIAAFENEYARMPKSPMNYQSPTSMLNPHNQPPAPPNSSPTPTGLTSGPGQTLQIPNRASYIPPSVAFQASFPRSPTTFDAPTSPPLPVPPSAISHVPTDSASTIGEVLETPSPPPRTPAYPAYTQSPAPVPPTPFWQTPLAQQSGVGGVNVGPSVEIRRERGGAVPQTPGPTVGGFFGGLNPMGAFQQQQSSANEAVSSSGPPGGGGGMGPGGEPIIVSVGLLSRLPSALKKGQVGPGELYPLDQFTLDIFVFNQSSWTRRFEVSYPDERRRRRKAKMSMRRDSLSKGEEAAKGESEQPPGIIPLENRVRVGPLLPSTCQSVRMDFLALAPGVHSLDVLTLTDVQSGLSMHLRNVIDIIVREPASEAVI